VAWIAASIGLAWLLARSSASDSGAFNPLALAVLGFVGLLSAEHAKRLLENRQFGHESARKISRCLGRRVECLPAGRRGMNVLITLDLACLATELWPIIADLPRFLTIDPFHDRVTLQRLPAGKGVDLVLSHNAFGRRFLRFGRIIAWSEGQGYAFSDLSGRDPRAGFPHVFVVRIAAKESNPNLCSLNIRIRGRWTSRWVPALIGRIWVTWVCREHARLLGKAL